MPALAVAQFDDNPAQAAELAPPPVWRARWQSWWRVVRDAAHTQAVVTLGLLPLSVLLFGQISFAEPAGKCNRDSAGELDHYTAGVDRRSFACAVNGVGVADGA